jgi:hypothetical protein
MRLRVQAWLGGTVATLLAAACGARTGLELTIYDTGDDGDGGPDATTERQSMDARPSVDADAEASMDDARSIDVDFDVVLTLCSPADATTTDSGRCTGLACQVPSCDGGDTTLSGTVYAPNGTLPLFNVQVFVPNARLEPIPRGVQCTGCGGNVTGSPITSTYAGPTGQFVLTGVPAGENIPLVVQLGKWRRQTTIPSVRACRNNVLSDPSLTRLPKNQSEGNMPHIALTTGGCDQMGCMLPKVGIDASEFGSQADGYSKAINVYTGSGMTSAGTPDPTWTSATNLWGNPTGSLPSTGRGNITDYDLAILSCECNEAPDSKGTAGAPTFAWMTDYLNAGGRIFTTDFQYTWYKFSPDPLLGGGSTSVPDVGIGEIRGGAPGGGDPASLVTSFPKGAALAAWLKFVYSGVPLPSGATFTATAAALTEAQMGEISPDSMFSNIQSLDSTSTVTWANSPDPTGPRVFTVDTPVGQPVAKQCGRGVHLDMHVDEDDEEVESGYPTTGCTTPLKPDEAMFAFFFFDLSSCIQDETAPPMPPPSMPPVPQ